MFQRQSEFVYEETTWWLHVSHIFHPWTYDSLDMTTRTVSPLSLTHDLAGTVTLICVLTRGMGHGFYHDRYSQALWWRRLLIFPFIPRACPSLSPTSQPPLPDTYYPVPTLICKHDVFLLKKSRIFSKRCWLEEETTFVFHLALDILRRCLPAQPQGLIHGYIIAYVYSSLHFS